MNKYKHLERNWLTNERCPDGYEWVNGSARNRGYCRKVHWKTVGRERSIEVGIFPPNIKYSVKYEEMPDEYGDHGEWR